MGNILLEVLLEIGRLFMHPVLYIFFLGNILIGYLRTKRERKQFSSRVRDMFYEVRHFFWASIGFGMVLTILTIGIGFVVPMNIVMLIGVGTVFFVVTTLIRYASPTYVIPIAAIVASLLANRGVAFFGYDVGGDFSLTSLAGLVAGLLFIEMLLWNLGKKNLSFPKIVRGKRGKNVGVQVVRRLNFIPVFVLLPVGDGNLFPGWWPLLSIGDTSYAFFLLPFLIGMVLKMRSTVPRKTLPLLVARIRMLALVVTILAVVSYWWSFVAWIAFGVAIIGRIVIDRSMAIQELMEQGLYTTRNNGFVVLGIVPDSPADKMGIQIGEIITKVNDVPITSPRGLFDELRDNRAFCKLEVHDIDGEPRIVQSALYDGEHYELGIMYVDNVSRS